MKEYIEMHPNPLVQYLNKLPSDFTKADLIKYIEDNNIEMINFRYMGWDLRLKSLNFMINGKQHLDTMLSAGERVDGSSLFSFIEAGSSDLYVVPRYRTAFLNPFSEIPTLDILCSYFTKDGDPLESAPEYILKKAHQSLKDKTGYGFEAMGELEYYVISENEDLFPAVDQKGYHESMPFAKYGNLRREAMRLIAQSGGDIKYGHSEVGNFSKGNLIYEQNEVEFLPTNVEDAADQLLVAKWIMRTLAYHHGVTLTFAPKITVGKAGSGMHVHTRLIKDGKNAMIANGKLSNAARKAIAGYLDLAPSLTAFGNTNPTSYFRLVPHQEAPTNICWGDRNRSVLVRVPLGWSAKNDMVAAVNPHETPHPRDFSDKQTVEFRCPDGSADVHLLMAGLVVAARHGFEMNDALNYAEKTYVDVDIFKNKEKLDQLEKLPTSCFESAKALERQKNIYTKDGVFTEGMLNWISGYLKKFNDRNIREEIGDDEDKIMELVNRFFYCG
ncbi:MAG: glutamine synthetase family protein [Bacteroidales bacterium]|nr:glutamine synthetase family protein [Bacteroidales bacterium]MCF8350236.1 glutamine synthetase family protein [Bacteroidales bacterium]MCF8375819.1 glutamine synthetase family protein [Bacteroidales bacterium]MCF8401745.1 glutamine synthetase family protein [Bacteroidales bacterium]